MGPTVLCGVNLIFTCTLFIRSASLGVLTTRKSFWVLTNLDVLCSRADLKNLDLIMHFGETWRYNLAPKSSFLITDFCCNQLRWSSDSKILHLWACGRSPASSPFRRRRGVYDGVQKTTRRIYLKLVNTA